LLCRLNKLTSLSIIDHKALLYRFSNLYNSQNARKGRWNRTLSKHVYYNVMTIAENRVTLCLKCPPKPRPFNSLHISADDDYTRSLQKHDHRGNAPGLL
jgi:hypothetical protein